MVVRAIPVARMMEFARRLAVPVLDDAERARHTQMHQQHIARGEVGHQIFGSPSEPGHGLAGQPRDKILLEWKPQVFPPRLRFHDFRPLHHRLQSATDGLDFR